MLRFVLSLFIFIVFLSDIKGQTKMNIGTAISYNKNYFLTKKKISILGVERSTTEENSLNSSVGFSLWAEFVPKNRISFLTGFDIFSYKVTQNVSGLVFGTDIDPALGGIVTNSRLVNKAAHTYIGIPLLLKLKINQKNNKSVLFAAIGLEPTAIFTKRNNSTIFYGDGSIESLSPQDAKLNAYTLLIVLNIGYSKRLSTHFSIQLVPFLKYSLMQKGERYLFENSNRYLSFGGALGISYDLF